jgi:hypothetical protein
MALSCEGWGGDGFSADLGVGAAAVLGQAVERAQREVEMVAKSLSQVSE